VGQLLELKTFSEVAISLQPLAFSKRHKPACSSKLMAES
jgi:hypothetical protein